MKQTFLLLLLLIVGMTSVKADNITVNGTSRSYNVIAIARTFLLPLYVRAFWPFLAV